MLSTPSADPTSLVALPREKESAEIFLSISVGTWCASQGPIIPFPNQFAFSAVYAYRIFWCIQALALGHHNQVNGPESRRGYNPQHHSKNMSLTDLQPEDRII